MPRVARVPGAVVAAMLWLASVATAGVTNPNLSVIGQPFTRWTDAAGDPAGQRAVLDVGETEFVYDDYLNPYAKGFFTVSLAKEGISLEEGYFTLLRGLPLGLTLRGGKYRVGFGKLNPMHPHAVPFAERFGVMAYLPGSEAFNETGVQLSARLPAPGDWSFTASGDVLQGDTFRIARVPSAAPNDPLLAEGDREQEPRPGVVGRLSAFGQIGDRSGMEFGLSATHGTNNVAAATRTTVLGGDAKLKLWMSANAYVLVQGELLHLDREDAGWDGTAAAYTHATTRTSGGYLYADYNFRTRYNLGASYERFGDPYVDATNQAVGAFAGLALLEETTAFRADFVHAMPGTPAGTTVTPDAVNTVTVRVIYSMGPHKAHQF
jgi:hypothetical protein